MSIGKYHYRFIKQFMKKDLNNIKITNGVPQVVFIFWFSNSDYIPCFSIRRFAALQSLISNIKVPIIIITQENINDWEVKNNTIHEGFKYLSGIHKSDYLRAYFLYHYGGGYHDIKYREKSWENEWEKS
jgi:mannosyltransferase OCH1-like enzyme